MGVFVNKDRCISCGGCVSVCAPNCLELDDRFPEANYNKCTNCNMCVIFCPVNALTIEGKPLQPRPAQLAQVVNGK